MIFKHLPLLCGTIVLCGCALVTPDAPVHAVYPDDETPKIPVLSLAINREYLFSHPEETRTRGAGKHPYDDDVQTTSRKGPFLLKEKKLMTLRLKESLFAEENDLRTKGKLDIDYTVQTNAKCSGFWPVLAVSTLFMAPVIGFPVNQACAFISVSATITDVAGNEVKTYATDKTRTMNLGFWYGHWSLTPANNPLQEMLVNEATADLANQIIADAPTLTARLTKAFREKYAPKKKRTVVRQKKTGDFY